MLLAAGFVPSLVSLSALKSRAVHRGLGLGSAPPPGRSSTPPNSTTEEKKISNEIMAKTAASKQ